MRLMVPDADMLIGLLSVVDIAPFRVTLFPVRLTAPVVAVTAPKRVVPVPDT